MSEAKFTKGPWKVNGRLIYSGSTFIATSSVTDVEWKECEANAALIAAAPEMYEMLKNVLASPYCVDMTGLPSHKDVASMLAKARGEQ